MLLEGRQGGDQTSVSENFLSFSWPKFWHLYETVQLNLEQLTGGQ